MTCETLLTFEKNSGLPEFWLAVEVFGRVNRRVLNVNFVVQMWPRRLARSSDCANHLSSFNLLAHNDVDLTKVAIFCCDAGTMIDQNRIAIARVSCRCKNDAIGGTFHNSAGWGGNVHSSMELPLATQRIQSFSKACSHMTLNGPNGGSTRWIGGRVHK